MKHVNMRIIDAAAGDAVRALPWKTPVSEWTRHRVRHLAVRRGPGRHPMAFVESLGAKLVVKELGVEGAEREIAVYRELAERAIEALRPVAVVVREEPSRLTGTAAGDQLEPVRVGHSVTRLAERVLPDSLLLPLGFTEENRRRILDAIADLFVDLHAAGVWWGDASLANTLVRFGKEDVPYVGRRTTLTAMLADAETVEIRPTLSDELRRADVDQFVESMTWLAEDLRASGLRRDDRDIAEDCAYFRGAYARGFALALREKEFEAKTGLRVRTMLGRVREAAYLDTLLRHIEEHKWYLSERAEREVSLPEAATAWHAKVFEPVCRLFLMEGILRHFPGRTASDLYVEVMTHKYFLSERDGRDAGMMAALRDYVERFGERPPETPALWSRLKSGLIQILGLGGRHLLDLEENDG